MIRIEDNTLQMGRLAYDLTLLQPLAIRASLLLLILFLQWPSTLSSQLEQLIEVDDFTGLSTYRKVKAQRILISAARESS